MIEFSLSQFFSLASMLFEFCNSHDISDSDFGKVKVRIHPPMKNGDIRFDIGIPSRQQ